MIQVKQRVDTSILEIVSIALFGVFLIFFTGFYSSSYIHDFEHDTRHSVGFPCH